MSIHAATDSTHSPPTLSFSSKIGLTAWVISGIVALVIMTLSAAGIFGRVGSAAFTASMVGGGVVTLISIGGVAWLVMRSSPDPDKQKLDFSDFGLSYDSSSQEGPDFAAWAEKIRACPPYQSQDMAYVDYDRKNVIPSRDFASLFIHVHQVLPHVYLGNYRSFLSVDPYFIQQYPMTDVMQDIFNGPPSILQQNWAAENLDFQGCVHENIKVVVSVTRFQSSVEEAEWSTFQPNLEALGIRRIEIPVDDVDDAWLSIEPHLETIFQEIDQAIQGSGNILIHCVKGASRSPAVLYAYLMKRCRVSLDEAYNYIRTIRPVVELKSSMRRHLENYAVV